MLIYLTCPGQPVSGKNGKRGFVHQSKKTGALYATVAKSKAVTAWYERVVPLLATQFVAIGVPTLRGPLHVEVDAYTKLAVDHQQSPDGDNVQTAAWDALKRALVIADDRQIVSWGGTRQQDAANPRVEITIRTL